MRVLVTGGNGFVGRHLCATLRARGDEPVVAGRTRDGDVDEALDLSDAAGVRAVVARVRPQLVYHLAAQAFVPAATADPLGTYDVNALGTARLFDALRTLEVPPRVLYASTAEVYGIRPREEYPLRETLVPRPATPYAASKLAGEAIALASFVTYGVPAVVTRAFNHIGPGQNARFAVASFASGLAAIAAGAPPLLPVGNLAAQRDFLDVRDVVAAYVALAERGEPGETYNVCSGTPVVMREVLRQLILLARVPVEVREEAGRLRPSDAPVSFGDNGKLRAIARWEPRISLAESLRDVYADARARVAAAS